MTAREPALGQPDEATADAWSQLGGEPRLLERMDPGPPGIGLASALPVMTLARAATACCALAAGELLSVRRGGPVPAARLDGGAIATAFTSERHLRIDGRPGATFAPLSRFWPTADGWIRTHANYPHHRARLLRALGLGGSDDASALVARVADLLAASPGKVTEERVAEAGGLAVVVRDQAGWAATAPGRAAASRPLIESLGSGPGTVSPLPSAALPAEGIRVLDLTRVIAGPVATRTLAFLGADVLRIDSPRLPELDDAHTDTGFGKRSATLDLADRRDRASFDELLSAADVLVTGYRPGALDSYGLSAPELVERHPGLVVAQLSAWGFDGPWAGRRGFDSLVQAATGIARLEASPEGVPGALPGQFLDHGTGYLLAAGVLRALTARHTTGSGRHLRLALATTASWLLGLPQEPGPVVAAAPGPWLTETDSPMGRLRHAVSPIRYDGAPTTWSRPPGRLGADPARW